MAVTSKFEGILIGHDEYTKEGKTTHTYYALITQKQDPETKLYEACVGGDPRTRGKRN